MPSFDIVSKLDMQEVTNAVDLVKRELGNRYDFKNVTYSIELKTKENEILLMAESEYCLEQLQVSLKGNLIKRKIDVKALDFQDPEKAGGNTLRQKVKIKEGIDHENAKKITKEIKASKMKVQASIQGDELRVTGKKLDDLQEVIEMVKKMDLLVPLQYVNFRS